MADLRVGVLDGFVRLQDDDTLQKIYSWIDEIPLSRPKRNITRDFSDGGECERTCAAAGDCGWCADGVCVVAVLMAEVVSHYFPRLVEMHNYSPANSVRQKMYNWSTLNRTCRAVVIVGVDST